MATHFTSVQIAQWSNFMRAMTRYVSPLGQPCLDFGFLPQRPLGLVALPLELLTLGPTGKRCDVTLHPINAEKIPRAWGLGLGWSPSDSVCNMHKLRLMQQPEQLRAAVEVLAFQHMTLG